YCITTGDKVYQLYSSNTAFDIATVRFGSITKQDPSVQIKPLNYRAVMIGITEDCDCTGTIFVDNRLSVAAETKEITYSAPTKPYTGTPVFSDVDTQVANLYWTTPDAAQGFK